MKKEDLERIDAALVQAEQIVEESLAQKQTIADMDLMLAILKLRKKVQKRIRALKFAKKP